MAQERLQKILARGGIASRRATEEIITSGRVRVNGRVVTELGTKADPRADKVELDGKRVVAEDAVYVICHKPRGVVSTLSDPEGRPTVASMLSSLGARLFPVGRLDFATSGALLATNDGEFSDGLLHPKRAVPKTYVVKVSGIMEKEHLDRWRNGITLEDGPTLPAEANFLRHEGDKTWFELTIKEGRNQQIRRMGEATGFPVMRLSRVAFAGVSTEGLAPGGVRPLTREELYALKKAYGVPRKLPSAFEIERTEEEARGPKRGAGAARRAPRVTAGKAPRKTAGSGEYGPRTDAPRERPMASTRGFGARDSRDTRPDAERPAGRRGEGFGAPRPSRDTREERPTRGPARPTREGHGFGAPRPSGASRGPARDTRDSRDSRPTRGAGREDRPARGPAREERPARGPAPSRGERPTREGHGFGGRGAAREERPTRGASREERPARGPARPTREGHGFGGRGAAREERPTRGAGREERPTRGPAPSRGERPARRGREGHGFGGRGAAREERPTRGPAPSRDERPTRGPARPSREGGGGRAPAREERGTRGPARPSRDERPTRGPARPARDERSSRDDRTAGPSAGGRRGDRAPSGARPEGHGPAKPAGGSRGGRPAGKSDGRGPNRRG
jgi:23S rRNA pseudouridine2605 synthase